MSDAGPKWTGLECIDANQGDERYETDEDIAHGCRAYSLLWLIVTDLIV